jgi:hypothetical protein
VIAGIDPGISGAIALYDEAEHKLVDLIDTPRHKVKVNGKDRSRVDLDTLAQWFWAHGTKIKHAVVENVHTMPGQGVASSGAFMRAFGNVESLAAYFCKVEYVSPAKWKREFGLSQDKNESRVLASHFLPGEAARWKLKKHDGRAEATLLAIYAVRHTARIKSLFAGAPQARGSFDDSIDGLFDDAA